MADGLPSLNDLATRARAENPFYIATIYQPSSGLGFRGWVPQQFNLSIHNNWEPVFGHFNEQGGTISKIATAIGVPVNVKALTQQIWTGTDPLEFEFTFMLDAYKDAFNDVQKPIQDLLRIATPVRNGIFLDSPGPTIISNQRRIYLRVGRFFFLDSIVITGINVTWHTLSDVKGQYQAADVSVSLRTAYTPDQQDILSYFERGNSDNTDPIYQNLVQASGINIDGQNILASSKSVYDKLTSPGSGSNSNQNYSSRPFENGVSP
jgi:hypothetical protein